MRAAALSCTLLSSWLVGCTLAFPLDDLQDGAGAGSSNPSSSVVSPTTSNMTSSGGAGQGGAGSSVGGNGTGAGTSYEATVLADGPVLYFRMSSSSTNEPNLGTNPLTSAPHSDPHALLASLVPGGDMATTYDDPAHDLNQTGEVDTGRLEVPVLAGFFQASQAFSIELWASLPSPDDVVETSDVVRSDGASGGFRLQLQRRAVSDGMDSVRFGFRDSATVGFDDYSSVCNFDDWVDATPRHFVVVYDPSATHQLAVYANGARCDMLAEQTTGAFAFPTLATPLLFGNGWSGALDEIALYDSALSVATICAHYEAGGGTCN